MYYCRNCQHDVTEDNEGHGSGCAVKEINDRHRAEYEQEEAERQHARKHGTVEPPREFADPGLFKFKTEFVVPEQREHVRATMRAEMPPASFSLYSVAYQLVCSQYDEWIKDREAWEARQRLTGPA